MNGGIKLPGKIFFFVLTVILTVVFGSVTDSFTGQDTVFPQEKVDRVCCEGRRGNRFPSLQHSMVQNSISSEMQRQQKCIDKWILFGEHTVPELGSNPLGDLYIGPDPDTLFIDTDYVQDGDIIIFGEGVLIVDNAKITLSGHLWIQDDGQAFLRNGSHLRFDQSYVGQYYAWLLDDGRFEATDATVDANGVMHYAHLHDHCTYIAKRTTFPDWTFRKVFDHSTVILEDVDYVGDLLVDDSCFVHFTRCDTLMPWFEIPDGSVITIQFPDPSFVDHFELSNEVSGVEGVGYRFIADNCRECWWSLETFPGCSVVVSNSIIRGSCFRIPSASDTFSVEGIVNYDMHPDIKVPLGDRHVRYMNTYVYWWNWYPMDQTVFYMDSCVFGEMIGKGGSEIYATRSTHDGHTILLGAIDSAFVSFTDGYSQAFVTSWHESTLLLVNSSVIPIMPFQSTNLAHGQSYILAVNTSFEYEPQAMDTALVIFTAIEGPDSGVIDGAIEIYGSAWIDAGPFNPVTFDRYRLYWAYEGDSAWTLIEESTETIHHNIITEWNTDGMDEGEYDLRLTIWDSEGDSLTAYKPVSLLRVLCSKGDVDDNGAVNILDVVLTVNVILKIHDPTPQEFCSADMDNNGTINILDVVQIVYIILGDTDEGQVK